jgi:hypothetical protein
VGDESGSSKYRGWLIGWGEGKSEVVLNIGGTSKLLFPTGGNTRTLSKSCHWVTPGKNTLYCFLNQARSLGSVSSYTVFFLLLFTLRNLKSFQVSHHLCLESFFTEEAGWGRARQQRCCFDTCSLCHRSRTWVSMDFSEGGRAGRAYFSFSLVGFSKLT